MKVQLTNDPRTLRECEVADFEYCFHCAPFDARLEIGLHFEANAGYVEHGPVVLRKIEPRMIRMLDDQTCSELFRRELTPYERRVVELWFLVRFNRQRESLTEEMSTAIEQHRCADAEAW